MRNYSRKKVQNGRDEQTRSYPDQTSQGTVKCSQDKENTNAGSKDSAKFKEELRTILDKDTGIHGLELKVKLELRDLPATIA